LFWIIWQYFTSPPIHVRYIWTTPARTNNKTKNAQQPWVKQTESNFKFMIICQMQYERQGTDMRYVSMVININNISNRKRLTWVIIQIHTRRLITYVLKIFCLKQKLTQQISYVPINANISLIIVLLSSYCCCYLLLTLCINTELLINEVICDGLIFGFPILLYEKLE